LCDAPVREVEIRIVAADDPRLSADAQIVRELAPGVAARVARPRDRVELPELPASGGVVRADVAGLGRAVAVASGQTLNDLAVRDDGSARFGVSPGPVGDHRLPDDLAGAGVERDEPRVVRREEHLVLVDRDVAHRADAD